MKNFDEDEFEKSLASIVDETTADAEAYVRETDSINTDNDSTEEDVDDEEDTETTGEKVRRILIIVAIVLALFAIIGVSTYIAVKTALEKSKDNYSYYNSLGYESYNEKDYESAIVNFEKALTYEEGKSDSKDNINMMLFLYESYNNVGKTDKAEQILKKIITVNPGNEKAYYNLIALYETQEEYPKIRTLYDSLVNTEYKTVVAMFNKFLATPAHADTEPGQFTEDIVVELICDDTDSNIYYSVGDTDPKLKASVYTEPLEISSGSTTINFYTCNRYGFESDVTTVTYNIEYEGPAAPRFVPADLSISQVDKVKVYITNIKEGCDVYYTTDGSTPTQSSRKYNSEDPIVLPAGTTLITALVVDSHGLTSIGTHTYTVTYLPSYTEEDAIAVIWERLIEKGIVDEEHKEVSDGLLCELKIKKKNEVINGRNLYVFYFSANGINYDFYYGVDVDNEMVYRLESNGTSYTIIETL